MNFWIFKKKICVPVEQSMVAKYANSVGPFTDKTAEYLAVTSGCNEDSSLEELQKGICDGINEECEVYDHREEIVAKAMEKGLITRKVVKNPFAKIHQAALANGGTLPSEVKKEMMEDAIREVRTTLQTADDMER